MRYLDKLAAYPVTLAFAGLVTGALVIVLQYPIAL